MLVRLTKSYKEMLSVMSVAREPGPMVKYQFEVEDEKWNQWKNTVPRSKSLEERIIELIEADTEGRVQAPSESDTARAPAPEPSGAPESAFSGLTFPSSKDRDECIETVLSAREYLRENGTATMRDFVTDVMPEHSLGYNVPDLAPGERYRGSWWRKVVKPGLEALPDVEKPGTGESEWEYVGGNDAE